MTEHLHGLQPSRPTAASKTDVVCQMTPRSTLCAGLTSEIAVLAGHRMQNQMTTTTLCLSDFP